MTSTLMSGYSSNSFAMAGPEYRVGRMLACGDADGAGGFLAEFAEGAQVGGDFFEPRADGCDQALALPPRSVQRCASCASAGGCRAAPLNGEPYG